MDVFETKKLKRLENRTIRMPALLQPFIEKRCRQLYGRTDRMFSTYVRTLIIKDIKQNLGVDEHDILY